jgi:HPr kinase/phosphorylase
MTAAQAAVGLFDPVHPARSLVLGEAASAWWHKADAPTRATLPARLAGAGVRELICSRGAPALDEAAWSLAGIALIEDSETAAHERLARLRARLSETAPATTLHGVFLSVLGLGVLIMGPSGVGKSELALDLISRGHPLVADDAVELRRLAEGVLVGASSPLLAGFMEARGLGVLNIARCHGPQAVRRHERLDLIIRLDDAPRPLFSGEERLRGRRDHRRLLDVAVPEIFLARGLGHNLAPMVETACRDHWLRLTGYHAADAFEARQQLQILDPPPP